MTYLHHVEGRLRVRSARLRRDEAAGAAVRNALSALAGVEGIETSALTGSITVRYDAAMLTHEAILDELRRLGHPGDGPASPSAVEAGRPVLDQVAAKVAKAAAELVLERLVGRAATALIIAMV